MGNVSYFKKTLAIVLAATCMLVFSFGAVFASETSPTVGDKYDGVSTGEFTVSAVSETGGTASMSGVNDKSIKVKKVPQTTSYGGKTFTVVSIEAKAFSGCKNLKVVKIAATKCTKISKSAFSGLKTAKIKVKVTKKMSKKNFKKVKKQLIAAGIKAKNIKKY